jgi:hypothetical protein
MAEWSAFVGRLTLFPSAPAVIPLPSAPELYRRIWGSDPDNFQKAQNPLSADVAQGKRGLMVAHCVVHPTRIDLNLGPAPDSGPTMNLPLIVNRNGLHAEMERMMSALDSGGIVNPISRVALYLQLLSPQPNSVKANEAVTSIIPVEYGVKISNEEDFIFQINKPYVSKAVLGTRMNCITKWSVERIQVVSITLAGGSVPHGAQVPSPQTTEFVAGSMSFDVNNLPVSVPLPYVQQAALLREARAVVNRIEQETGLNSKGFSNAEPN